MKRMTRSFRTRKNVIETNAVRDEFIKQLTLEADAFMKQLTAQFNQTLQIQMSQAMQGIVPGDNTLTVPAATGQFNTIGSVGQLLATGARYLVSRPRTSRDTQESSRSIDANTTFKLSKSQAAVEMQTALSQADKNT